MKPKTNSSSSPVWLYILLWLFFTYLYFQILSFNQGYIENPLLGVLYFILFGVHEAAHIVFGFLPPVLVASAGSISEIIFTSLVVFAAFRARAKFLGVFALLWLMLAMNSAGNYMADARTQAMPLIGPGSSVTHDWNFVFSQLGWLNNDVAIGTALRVLGDSVGALALVYGLFVIVTKLIESDR